MRLATEACCWLCLGSPKQEQGQQQVPLSTFIVNLCVKHPASVDLLFCVFVVGNTPQIFRRTRLSSHRRNCCTLEAIAISLLSRGQTCSCSSQHFGTSLPSKAAPVQPRSDRWPKSTSAWPQVQPAVSWRPHSKPRLGLPQDCLQGGIEAQSWAKVCPRLYQTQRPTQGPSVHSKRPP